MDNLVLIGFQTRLGSEEGVFRDAMLPTDNTYRVGALSYSGAR